MAEGDEEKRALEQQLERAVTARIQHFKDQADLLTLESVRRLLEKDLGFEKFALDAHKRFIRHYLEKKMEGADDGNPNPTTENEQLSKEEKLLPKQEDAKSDQKKVSTGKEETMEDSPIMGVLTPKSAVGTQESSISKITVKNAILERADHIQANSDKITLAGVRRLLEEDLGLGKETLKPFKDFISQQIDEVLLHGAKSGSKNAKSKISKRANNKVDCNTVQSRSDEMRDKVKLRKEATPKKNIKKLEELKKRKISNNADTDVSHKKPNKIAKIHKEEDDNSEDESPSEDDQSQSSVARSAQKKKEISTPGYGKRVEKLKSIIKACGMSVPLVMYKKVKQVPDDERETFLVKELKGILSREGLSENPTEKEIDDCRNKKETARELEGIDTSNIISSSRRRSTFSFAAPEKSEVRAKKDKIVSKDSKKKVNSDKDHNDDNKDEVEKEKEKEKGEEEPEKEEMLEEEEDEEEEEEEDDEEEEEDDDEDESEDFNEDDNEESD